MKESQNQGDRPGLCGARLLTVSDVAGITGLCYAVASDLIDETGRAIVLHSHKYVFDTSLFDYLQSKAGSR